MTTVIRHPVANIQGRLLRKNKNWLANFVGETGSGKTYGALHLAERISPRFDIENVVFSPLEFFKRLDKGDLRKGDVIVFDEAGVGMSNRRWYSVTNVMMSFVLQSFRRDNIAVIFTQPDMGFLDTAGRKLSHAILETVNIDYEYNKLRVKWFNSETNPRSGKIYNKYYRISPVGQKYGKLVITRIGLPSKSIREPYEVVKEKFTIKVKKQALQNLRVLEEKDIVKHEVPKPLSEYVEELMENNLEKSPTMYQIKNHFNVSLHKAGAIRAKYKELEAKRKEMGEKPKKKPFITHSHSNV